MHIGPELLAIVVSRQASVMALYTWASEALNQMLREGVHAEEYASRDIQLLLDNLDRLGCRVMASNIRGGRHLQIGQSVTTVKRYNLRWLQAGLLERLGGKAAYFRPSLSDVSVLLERKDRPVTAKMKSARPEASSTSSRGPKARLSGLRQDRNGLPQLTDNDPF